MADDVFETNLMIIVAQGRAIRARYRAPGPRYDLVKYELLQREGDRHGRPTSSSTPPLLLVSACRVSDAATHEEVEEEEDAETRVLEAPPRPF